MMPTVQALFPDTYEHLKALSSGWHLTMQERYLSKPNEAGCWWATYPDGLVKLFDVKFENGKLYVRSSDTYSNWFTPNLSYLTNWNKVKKESEIL